MTYTCDEYRNLRVQLKEKKRYKNAHDEMNEEPAVFAQFRLGIFRTKDPATIKMMNKYQQRSKYGIKSYDEEEQEFVNKKMEEAKIEAAEEYLKKSKAERPSDRS